MSTCRLPQGTITYRCAALAILGEYGAGAHCGKCMLAMVEDHVWVSACLWCCSGLRPILFSVITALVFDGRLNCAQDMLLASMLATLHMLFCPARSKCPKYCTYMRVDSHYQILTKWRCQQWQLRIVVVSFRLVNDNFIHCLITIYSFIRSDND